MGPGGRLGGIAAGTANPSQSIGSITAFARPQDRNAFYLILNTGAGAALGLVFWVFAARGLASNEAEIGVAYAIISFGTLAAVLAKGGLDTALLLHLPTAGRNHRNHLLRLATGVSTMAALLVVLALATLATASPTPRGLGLVEWSIVGAIAALLAIIWLQGAWFLAEGAARFGFQRNVASSVARLGLLGAFLWIGLPHPVAWAWALALVVAALAGLLFARRPGAAGGQPVPADRFLGSALHNVSGSAAEFLPGLLLAPMVLALDGPAGAAYFAMAWTAASLLFLACAAIGRSALASMAGRDPAHRAAAVRRGVLQLVCVVLPAAVIGLILAPAGLSVVGPTYALGGTTALRILLASTLFVAPVYLYLAVLRAQERRILLWVVPAAVAVTLLLAAPALASRFGLAGVALAWTVAHAPLGCYAAWKLRDEGWGVNANGFPAPFARHPHAE